MTGDDLKIMQAWDLERKIRVTQLRIMEWYEYYDGKVYVSFSGGKDSTVLLDLARRIYPDIKAVYIDTGLEYPEIKSFVKTFDNVDIIKPKMNFVEVVKKHGYPVISKEVAHAVDGARKGQQARIDSFNGGTVGKNGKIYRDYSKHKYLLDAPFKISAYCCDVMKKAPAHAYSAKNKSKPILGTLAVESYLRKTAWYKTGCNGFDSKYPKSQPLSFWTEQDILKYLYLFDVKPCEVYGDLLVEKDSYSFYYGGDPEPDRYKLSGAQRTGCLFCPTGCQHDKKYCDDLNRYERLKIDNPKLYNYCIYGGEYVDGIWQPDKNGLGLNKVLDYIGVEY